jgi:limonene-1,2-epoxide hydrolase
MDWDDWARRFERTKGAEAFEALFAPTRTFQDPVTPPTSDVRAVSEMTEGIFPDWHQRVDRIRGGDDWAVFEWTGTATYRDPGADDPSSVPIVMHGATIVEVDADGLVTRWRDYLDTNDPIQQIERGLSSG